MTIPVPAPGLPRCHVTGKVGFATKPEAEATRVETGRESRLYRCRYCGLIHWGSAAKPAAIRAPRQRRPKG